jgi:hypothetical protein
VRTCEVQYKLESENVSGEEVVVSSANCNTEHGFAAECRQWQRYANSSTRSDHSWLQSATDDDWGVSLFPSVFVRLRSTQLQTYIVHRRSVICNATRTASAADIVQLLNTWSRRHAWFWGYLHLRWRRYTVNTWNSSRNRFVMTTFTVHIKSSAIFLYFN